jgi:hypothetical protein
LKQLRTALGTNTKQIITGLDALKRGQAALGKFNFHFSTINSLCSKSVQDTQTDGNLRGLATMHLNLLETLKSTETIAGLPDAAEKAESMMKDSNPCLGMVRAHEYLSQVEATVYRVRNTLKVLQHYQTHQLPSLETYFRQVHSSMAKVEHKLWSIVRSFIKVGKSSPHELVAALRMIETQELVDAKLLSEGLGDSPLRKGWRYRCIQNMSASIGESFAEILQQCSKIGSSEVNSGVLLQQILSNTSGVLLELDEATEKLVPCFPAKYRIEDFLWGEYRFQVYDILEIIGVISGQLSNADILYAIHWVQVHRKYLVEDVSNSGAIRGTDPLMQTYVDRMDGALRNWLKNIMRSDFEAAPREDSEGHLFTPGPQDMFRLLEEQLDVAKTGGVSLLERVILVIREVINDYALEYQRKISEESHSLEILCAVGNNCLRTCELVSHLSKTIDALLSQGQVSQLDLSSRFQNVAKQAGEKCGQAVFMDPGFGKLFSLLCDGDEWREGVATGSVLATLDDFLSDFRVWLDDYLLNILATSMLIECISYYLAALLSQLRKVDTDTLGILARDSESIREYFKRYLSQEVVENECQVLSDMCHFLGSDSIESFVLSYMALLEQAPITPALLSGVLNSRVASQHDMTKADAKEVIAACREAYDDMRKTHKQKSPIKKNSINPAIKNPAFIAAITCVRQRC